MLAHWVHCLVIKPLWHIAIRCYLMKRLPRGSALLDLLALQLLAGTGTAAGVTVRLHDSEAEQLANTHVAVAAPGRSGRLIRVIDEAPLMMDRDRRRDNSGTPGTAVQPTCSNASDCTAGLQAALDSCAPEVLLTELPNGRSWITHVRWFKL